MIDTTARTIISAQESSRDPHNDVDYATGFESGDEEHPSYRSCKPRSGNHEPDALAGDRALLGLLEPSDQRSRRWKLGMRPLSRELSQNIKKRVVSLRFLYCSN